MFSGYHKWLSERRQLHVGKSWRNISGQNSSSLSVWSETQTSSRRLFIEPQIHGNESDACTCKIPIEDYSEDLWL